MRRFIDKIVASRTFSTLAVFASVSMITSMVSSFCGLLQARWVGPELVGEFRKYGILTGYCSLFVIPVQDGLMRQFPYLIGKGRKDEALQLAGVAKLWQIWMAIILSLVMFTLSMRSLLVKDWYGVVGWGGQVFGVIAATFGSYQKIIYRRSLEFKRLSYNGFVTTVCTSLALVAVYYIHYWGIAIRSILEKFVGLIMDYKYIPERIVAKWNRDKFFNLCKMSIPLSLAGYIRTSLFFATFGWLTLYYCGREALGLYATAVTFRNFAFMFVDSMEQIFNVRIANKFGETDSIGKSVKSVLVPTMLGLACSIVFMALLCVCIKPFVEYFIPKYVDAIPVVRVLSLSMPIRAMVLPTLVIKTALKYKELYSMAICKVLITILFIIILPKDIVWFAGAVVMSEFVDLLLGYYYLWRFSRKPTLKHFISSTKGII